MGTRRVARLLTALALTTAPVVTTTATHVPTAGAAGLPAPPIVKVVLGSAPSEMTVDTVNPRRAGRVTFEVTTTSDEPQEFTVVREPLGIAPEQTISLVEAALEQETGPDLAALRQFNRLVPLIGGAVAVPGQTSTWTLTLVPGVYFLLHTNAPARDAITHAKRLEVRGTIAPTAFPAVSSTVTMTPGNGLTVSRHLPESAQILVRNSSAEPHFVTFDPITPGTTDAQVKAVFDRALGGDEHAFDDGPYLDGPFAATALLSPGYQGVFGYGLAEGQYLMACYFPGVDTGLPHAFTGMYKVVYIG
jgi:hypothetical protein